MYIRIITSAAAILLSLSLCFSQGNSKLEKQAEDAFYNERLVEALTAYQQILESDPENALAQYRAEICSLLTIYKSKSIDKLSGLYEAQSKKDRYYYYWLGRVYHARGEFDPAIENWNRFLSSNDYKSEWIISETQSFIESSNFAKTQFNDSTKYEVERVEGHINSAFTEYSPVYFIEKHELLFLSSRDSKNSGKEPFKIYHSVWNGKDWDEPTVLNQLGTFSAQNANIEVVSNDGRLFFYRDTNKGELYYSETVDDKWGDPVRFDAKINVSKLESHFFINEHENRVLFAARKKGGTKDLDIFESFKDVESGEWTPPVHFDSQFNSEYDEDYPYLSPDHQTLYFSSKGHNSIGGYDIFKTVYDEPTRSWSAPEPLKYPINSLGDDIQFKIDEESDAGYFVSNREGPADNFDIYFFHESRRVLLQGSVSYADGSKASNALIELFPKKLINFSNRISTDANGLYQVSAVGNDEIKVEVSVNGEVLLTDYLIMPEVSDQPVSVHKDFVIGASKPIAASTDVDAVDTTGDRPVDTPDDGSRGTGRGNRGRQPDNLGYDEVRNIGTKFRKSNKALINNIYFSFDQHHISNDASQSLQELVSAMKSNKRLKVMIAGHTDSVGPEDVNLRVSQRRAEAVVEFLVNSGIAKRRVQAKGFGETRPLASNDDEMEGRELNRRIEVIVLE